MKPSGPLRCGPRQDLPRLHLERLGQFPHGAKGDRAARFDPLVVPKAEPKVHHVFLREGAGLPQRANAAPEKQAEACKVCRHREVTLEAGGHPDHGSKCRRRFQGLRRSPNGATMVRMSAKLCVVLECLLLASLGGCGGGNQAASHPDASAVTGGSVGSAGTGGGGTGGQLSRPPAPHQRPAFPALASPARALPARPALRFARLRGRLRRVCAPRPARRMRVLTFAATRLNRAPSPVPSRLRNRASSRDGTAGWNYRWTLRQPAPPPTLEPARGRSKAPRRPTRKPAWTPDRKMPGATRPNTALPSQRSARAAEPSLRHLPASTVAALAWPASPLGPLLPSPLRLM